MESSCNSLILKLEKKYNLENIRKFIDSSYRIDGLIELKILDKETNKKLAFIFASINSSNNRINIGLVGRDNQAYGNIRNTFTRGLGKILLYLVACKANSLGYNIYFTSNPSKDNKLSKYYNKLGFTRKNNSTLIFNTNPSVLLNKIKNTDESFNNSIKLFKPNWLKNNYGDYIIQCPICSKESGSALIISHTYECPNKLKAADISDKPLANNGQGNMTGGFKKRLTLRKKLISRKTRRKA